MADQVAHTKETDADEPLVNGELPMEEAPPSCCHVMSLSSMDVDVDADAEGDVDATASSSCVATASQLNPSPPPAGVQQAKPARSSSPPCQLLERLSFPDGNIINTLHTILALPPFDPYAPAPKAETVYKEVVSLMQWSQREDNAIELELSDKLLHECEHKGGDPNDETRSYLVGSQKLPESCGDRFHFMYFFYLNVLLKMCVGFFYIIPTFRLDLMSYQIKWDRNYLIRSTLDVSKYLNMIFFGLKNTYLKLCFRILIGAIIPNTLYLRI